MSAKFDPNVHLTAREKAEQIAGCALFVALAFVAVVVIAIASVGGYFYGHRRGVAVGESHVWALAIEARVAVIDPYGERTFITWAERLKVDGHSPQAIHDGRTYPPGAWIDPCRKPIGSANP